MAIAYPRKDLVQLIERFLKLHPNIISLSKGVPSKTQGNNGDIQIVGRGDRVSLYVKANEKWHRFDKILGNDSLFKALGESKSNNIHIIHGGFLNTQSLAVYIPFVAEIEGSHNQVFSQSFMWPYSGKIKKIMFRAEGALGVTGVTIYKAGDTIANPNITVESYSQNMTPDDTPYTYYPTQSNFVEGELMSIKINPTNDFGDVLFTIVLEYTNIN